MQIYLATYLMVFLPTPISDPASLTLSTVLLGPTAPVAIWAKIPQIYVWAAACAIDKTPQMETS